MIAVLSGGQGDFGAFIPGMLIWIVAVGAMMYFLSIKPQKKERARMAEMLSGLELGDSVLTTGGFYGVVIDIMDEIVVVEFGSNKNCRIPMKKGAILEVEKPNQPKVETTEKK